jgi:hypothetical protein
MSLSKAVQTLEGAAPVHVRLFGTQAEVQCSCALANLVEQARSPR